jgi:serine/threonine protein phosphatase PrpC
LIVGVLLADGIGGGERGDEAASDAIATIVDSLASSVAVSSASIESSVEQAVERANHRVFKRFDGGGGCTLSGVIFTDALRPTLLHVGDSRIYQLDRHELITLTTDDTLLGHLRIEKSDVRYGEAHFRQLVRYIGMEPLAFASTVQRISLPRDPGTIIITSDGVHGTLDQQMLGIIERGATPLETAYRLVTAAEWCNSRDNATAAVISALEILESFQKPLRRNIGRTMLIYVWDAFSQLQILQPAMEVSLFDPAQFEDQAVVTVQGAPKSGRSQKRTKRKRPTQPKLPEAKFR